MYCGAARHSRSPRINFDPKSLRAICEDSNSQDHPVDRESECCTRVGSPDIVPQQVVSIGGNLTLCAHPQVRGEPRCSKRLRNDVDEYQIYGSCPRI